MLAGYRQGDLMAGRSFLTDSKSFLVYDNLSIAGKIHFWIKFPFVYFRYIKLMYFDKDVRRELQLRKDWELAQNK